MDQPLTTVQLLPELSNGGVEQCVVAMNRALIEAGHRNIVISGGGEMVAQILSDGGEHIEAQIWKKSPSTLRSVFQLRRLIRQLQPDIVHAHSRIPAWIGSLALRSIPRRDRPPLVTTIHGLHRPSPFSRIMVRSDFVIGVSQTALDHFRNHYPNDISDQRSAVVHRGVESSDFPYQYQASEAWLEEWYTQYPNLRDAFVVCLPGRLTRLKGHVDLLTAIAALAKDGIVVQTLFAGGEDPRRLAYLGELKKRIVDLKLESQVSFTGHRRDLRDILSTCDAVVSVSQKPESFGLAVLESIKLGRVTLGYDHGGVGEVMAKIYPEGLIEPHDPAALADKLRMVFEGKLPQPKPNNEFQLSDWQSKELAVYAQVAKQT